MAQVVPERMVVGRGRDDPSRVESLVPGPPRRLNVGCAGVQPEGWDNVDVDPAWGQTHVGDVARHCGLPFDDGTFDLVVSVHMLQALTWPQLIPALTEMRRVTRRGGWIRLVVPDLLAAVAAYERHDAAHFQVAHGIERSLPGKLCVYVTQAGATRSVFTDRWLIELLHRAGWSRCRLASFGETDSGHPDLCALDSRPGESIFAEARNH